MSEPEIKALEISATQRQGRERRSGRGLFFPSWAMNAGTAGAFFLTLSSVPGLQNIALDLLSRVSPPDSTPPDPAPHVDRVDLEAQGYLPSVQLVPPDENLDERAWERPTGAPPPDDSVPERLRVSKAREIEERIANSGDQQMASVGVADVAVASPTEEQAGCVDYISVPYESLPTLAFKHRTTVEAIMAANGVGSEAKLMSRTSILVPVTCEPDASGQPQAVHEPAARAQVCQRPYTVGVGDTLSAIARSCGVTVADLAAANGIDDPDKIFAGQKLLVPTGPVARPMDSPAVKAQESATIGQDAVSEVFVFRGARSEPPPGVELAGHYTVHPGVTVANLCEALGVTPAQLAAVNPAYAKYILKYGILYPGLRINVPKVDNLPPHDLLVGSTFIDHEVQEGDTVDDLAVRYGTPIYQIQQYNPGVMDSGDLKPGMTLTIPAFPEKMKEGEKIAEDGDDSGKPYLPVITKGVDEASVAGTNGDGTESSQQVSPAPTDRAASVASDGRRGLARLVENVVVGASITIPESLIGEGLTGEVLGPDGKSETVLIGKGEELTIRGQTKGPNGETLVLASRINPQTGESEIVRINITSFSPELRASIGGIEEEGGAFMYIMTPSVPKTIEEVAKMYDLRVEDLLGKNPFIKNYLVTSQDSNETSELLAAEEYWGFVEAIKDEQVEILKPVEGGDFERSEIRFSEIDFNNMNYFGSQDIQLSNGAYRGTHLFEDALGNLYSVYDLLMFYKFNPRMKLLLDEWAESNFEGGISELRRLNNVWAGNLDEQRRDLYINIDTKEASSLDLCNIVADYNGLKGVDIDSGQEIKLPGRGRLITYAAERTQELGDIVSKLKAGYFDRSIYRQILVVPVGSESDGGVSQHSTHDEFMHGVIHAGLEGKIIGIDPIAPSSDVTLMMVDRFSGKLMVKNHNGEIIEIEQDKFLPDLGYKPREVFGDNGKGYEWEILLDDGKIIVVQTYGLDISIAQRSIIDIVYILARNPESIVAESVGGSIDGLVLTNDPYAGAAGVYRGVEYKSGKRIAQISLQPLSPVRSEAGTVSVISHELGHLCNEVEISDGKRIPAFPRIIDEGLALYNDYLITGNLGTLLDIELSSYNRPEIRDEVLQLEVGNTEILRRYDDLSQVAAKSFDEVGKEAQRLGRLSFLTSLQVEAKQFALEEGRTLRMDDILLVAERVWPGYGAELLSKYHIFFVRAAWE